MNLVEISQQRLVEIGHDELSHVRHQQPNNFAADPPCPDHDGGAALILLGDAAEHEALLDEVVAATYCLSEP